MYNLALFNTPVLIYNTGVEPQATEKPLLNIGWILTTMTEILQIF